jgi:hypothetical protein
MLSKRHSREDSDLLAALLIVPAVLALATSARAGDLAFSDPASTPKPPACAVGQASRDPGLDALPGFKSPPAGFGAVPFFWWLGDPLTKQRLAWELDRFSNRHISGLQINYAHSAYGGLSFGWTLASDPPLFSEKWWHLTNWFLAECKRRGTAISLSDYTLGIGRGWTTDKLLAAHPELNGILLEPESHAVAAGPVAMDIDPATISLTAYRVENDKIVPGSGVDLRPLVKQGKLFWTAPAGPWRIWRVKASRHVPSLDPMNPRSGPQYAKAFFGQFEDRNPGEGGKGINFFFSDELDFHIGGTLWTAGFDREFKNRKGYDLVPEMAALWTDVGPRTPKIRLDYSDVKVALTEEGYFKPVFDWHQARGMTLGCDHSGRGTDVTEFGDYFRTHRWMQGPGADQPGLGKELIKAKVASSIAHLYQRPRVWLEGWYGSGWGTTSSGAADALFADFVMGYNLLSFHGCYYSTHGGWWEWAPPCNTYHMPYWQQMGPFMDCAQRLSYLFTQGTHACDVAVVYPVAPKEAGMDGDLAVKTAFDSGRFLYGRNLDFDFIDFESIARAKIDDGRLCVSGETYRVLVLPAMKAVRQSTLEKAAEFARQGGTVVAVAALPEAGDRLGRDDPELDRLNREVFGLSAVEVPALRTVRTHALPGGGRGIVVRGPAEIEAALGAGFPRDFRRAAGSGGYVMHRKLGPRDLYAIYDMPRGESCVFRARGQVELWDPWTGAVKPLPVAEQSAATTRLTLPLGEKEIQLIIFSPGSPLLADQAPIESARSRTVLSGDWEFELKPCLDNRWGDYHWPPTHELIGAEARYFRYADEQPGATGWEKPSLDDRSWRTQTCSFGQQFWKLGPMPVDAVTKAVGATLAAAEGVDPASPWQVGNREYRWSPYDFSWRFGVENDPGYQGYHGLKERMYDEYIRLGRLEDRHVVYQRVAESAGTRYYLWTSVFAPQGGRYRLLHGGMAPAAAWLNGEPLSTTADRVSLHAGSNRLLLRYDKPGSGHFTFVTPQSGQKDSLLPGPNPEAGLTLGTLAMRWNGDPTVLRFDVRPRDSKPAGWYRFISAPGLKALLVTAQGKLTAWAGGVPCTVVPGARRSDGAVEYRLAVASPSPKPVLVALRVEQERGLYGGAAIPEPVRQECGAGNISLGDWGATEGLRCYSGAAWYRKSWNLAADSLSGKVYLDLGRVVSTAEVRVNDRAVGIKAAPPWRWDVADTVRPGENRIEVLVYNTLANHYQTIPSRYKGYAESGILGPARLEIVEFKTAQQLRQELRARLQRAVAAVSEALARRPVSLGKAAIDNHVARGKELLGRKNAALSECQATVDALEEALVDLKYVPERNLALRKPVRASSAHPGHGVQDLTSGHRDGESFWSSDDSRVGNDHAEWVVIDLGKAAPVDAVVLASRGGNSDGCPLDLRIGLSADGVRWKTVVSVDDAPLPTGGRVAYEFAVHPTRYVRIEGARLRPMPSDGNQYRMQLGAVEVFGPEE